MVLIIHIKNKIQTSSCCYGEKYSLKIIKMFFFCLAVLVDRRLRVCTKSSLFFISPEFLQIYFPVFLHSITKLMIWVATQQISQV